MGKERRRFNRLVVSLPVKFSVVGQENEPNNLGILKNIGLGGLYIECPPPLELEKGQILNISIAATLPSLDIQSVSHLAVKGEVVRLDPPLRPGRSWGIAIRFLEEIKFAAPPSS